MFAGLLPEILRRLRRAFRYRDAGSREEAIAEGVAFCCLSYKRLYQRGRSDTVTAANLVWYAIKRVRCGRSVGCRLNSRETLAWYVQRRRGFRIERLPLKGGYHKGWIDAIAQDRRSTILDLVAARLDVAAWLTTLSRRSQQIASALAHGGTTSEVAHQHGVTAGRISQLRLELAESWRKFQHESTDAN